MRLVLQMEFDGLPLDLRASFERIVKAVPAFGLEQAPEPYIEPSGVHEEHPKDAALRIELARACGCGFRSTGARELNISPTRTKRTGPAGISSLQTSFEAAAVARPP